MDRVACRLVVRRRAVLRALRVLPVLRVAYRPAVRRRVVRLVFHLVIRVYRHSPTLILVVDSEADAAAAARIRSLS